MKPQPPPEAAALANASRELFAKGDVAGAAQVLKAALPKLATDAPSLHLMGLIAKAQNKLDDAERYFRSAIAYSFEEGGYYNDLGVVLQARGKYEEALRVYRAALALTPQAQATRVNIAHCLMAAGDLAAAEAEARAYIAAHPGPEAWTLLSQVHRAQGRDEDALAAAAEALKLAPNMRGLQLNHAVALDRVGRGAEALKTYAQLAAAKLDSADLAIHFARALYAADKKEEAEKVLEEGARLYPASAALHATLARVRALRGEGENATALMEAEIARRPDDLALRLACADALHRARAPQKALRIVEDALRRAPDAPSFLNAAGVLLDELDRPRDALVVLRRVAELAPGSRSARRNLLSTLIRAGQADEALSIARALRAEDPDEQYLIACEALALRVLGDEAYPRLYDYERLVRSYEIPAPRGFFTQENFNAALAEVLRRQHKANAHPLDQHLHHGSQTGRNLLALNEPNIIAFRAAVEQAIRDYIAKLEGDNPVAARKSERYRFAGMWSVRLGNEGYQPNHVHDRGWISSAYFVTALASESPREANAGALKFGEPNRPVAKCLPEKYVAPAPGALVLFPSYMWHGTVPFEGAERLSLAFDVAPA